jgi:pyridoxal phosphate enzyme (YggS family)
MAISMDHISGNWRELNERVADAASRAGRSASEISIIAVTKTRSFEEVSAALAAGVSDVGENRVQEAGPKRAQVPGTARWHLIGQLQRNKAGRAVDIFDVVQSVDSIRLADSLNRHAAEADRCLETLLQVSTSGAGQQGGVTPEELPALLDHAAGLDHLRVRGLMTIAAHSDNKDEVRGCFRRLHALAQEHRHRGPRSLDTLSMGMSGDYELAIEEGATMIRVGTVLFGERVLVAERAKPADRATDGRPE